MTIEGLVRLGGGSADDAGWIPVEALNDAEAVEELRRVRRLVARLEARASELIDSVARRGIPEAGGPGRRPAG